MRYVIVILFESIIIMGLLYLIISLCLKFKKEKKPDIEKGVREGVKSAIKELEEEKEQRELLMEKLDEQHLPDRMMSSIPDEETIRSGGELIPFNISDGEKELLRMFYNEK